MKIDHKFNFLSAFAYHTEKDAACANLLKCAAYVPVIGALAQTVFLKEAVCPFPESSHDWTLFGAFFGRFSVSLICPFLLPIIDGIGTIWYVVDEKKKTKV